MGRRTCAALAVKDTDLLLWMSSADSLQRSPQNCPMDAPMRAGSRTRSS